MNPFNVNLVVKTVSYIVSVIGAPAGLQIPEDDAPDGHRRFTWEDEDEETICALLLDDESCKVQLAFDHDCGELLQIAGWCALNDVPCTVNYRSLGRFYLDSKAL
jgi:hypothetical protein